MINTIRFIRKALDVDQYALAAWIGVSASTISRYERGTHKPSKKFVNALQNKLGVTDNDLVRIHMIHEDIKEVRASIRKGAGLDI